MENTDQENKNSNKYYSYKLMFDVVEDIDIKSIEIPKTMFDASNDVLESNNSEEDLIDYDEFENNEENLEALGFEGKTEAELQDFIMKKLMGEITEKDDVATAKDSQYMVQSAQDSEIPLEMPIENKIPDTNNNAELEEQNTANNKATTDISLDDITKEETVSKTEEDEKDSSENKTEAEKTNINKINIEDIDNDTQEIPESMFQIPEDETEKQLKEAEKNITENQNLKNDENTETNIPEKYEDPFDKFAKENSDKKKFVFALNQNQANIIDNIELKDRDLYIQHAIDLKIKFDSKKEEKDKKNVFITKIIIFTLTIVIGLPIVYKIVNWSIDSTLKNYEYCQKSFEKLFKEKYHYDENLK